MSEYLPENEREIVEALRQIVLECLPESREKLSYNVPYYFCNRRVAFIWPAAVPWGKMEMQGVQLGFCQGHLLDDPEKWLEKADRKVIRTKTFHHLRDLEPHRIREFLFQARLIDDES
ncbi:MAG: DUF1801 domain-containing protein [Bacteroidota bacterium]